MENIASLVNAIVAVPLLGMLFAALSREGGRGRVSNVLSVGIFTVLSNLVVLWRTALQMDVGKDGWKTVESFAWTQNPKIELVFGIDVFSLMLIAAVHLAVLLGMVGIRHNTYRQKALIVFALMFLSMISGYFLASDLFSFYIFFEALLLPLFMMVGIFGDVRKQQVLYRFFLYNLLGAVFLFVALVVLYNHENVGILEVSRIVLSEHGEVLVWGSIFIAFLSRIPVWPFHYWISSVNANISNPLVFIVANIVPLSGVYGLIRFFPVNAPAALDPYLLVLEIISIVTMLMIAFIGFTNRDIQYKIFAYMTVYYILYLLGALLPTDALLMNIGFSMFSYLIIVAALEVMVAHVDAVRQENELGDCGILCNIRRTSLVFSFLILAAIGMPLSSMFLNNMVIFAGLLKFNIQMAVCILLAVVLASVSLLQQLFYLKYPPESQAPLPAPSGECCVEDISLRVFAVMLLTAAVLVLSFVNPLWFVG